MDIASTRSVVKAPTGESRMTGAPDRRPTLAAADLHARIREAAFALLLAERRPLTPGDVGGLVGMTASAISPLLDELRAVGWIDRDASGRVTGSGGLSLTDGPNKLTIDGSTFRSWCAYDSLGIAAALAADATITTACAVCGVTIELRTARGQPPTGRPERLWLAEGGADLRTDFCAPTVLLCSPSHADSWAVRLGRHGRIVDLTEAAALGAVGWASSAATVVRVRGVAS
jgi:hypothetical protein